MGLLENLQEVQKNSFDVSTVSSEEDQDFLESLLEEEALTIDDIQYL